MPWQLLNTFLAADRTQSIETIIIIFRILPGNRARVRTEVTKITGHKNKKKKKKQRDGQQDKTSLKESRTTNLERSETEQKTQQPYGLIHRDRSKTKNRIEDDEKTKTLVVWYQQETEPKRRNRNKKRNGTPNKDAATVRSHTPRPQAHKDANRTESKQDETIETKSRRRRKISKGAIPGKTLRR